MKKITGLFHRILRYKHLVTILLILVVLAGGSIRVYQAIHYTNFYGDSGRDLLVARHIALYGEKIIVGHSASGFGSIFYYPPYYYYLLAVLYRIGPSVEFFAIFFALLNTLSILLVFLIGRELVDLWVGLVSALFVSLSADLIFNANPIQAVNFGLPLFWLSYWLFLRSLKKRKTHLFVVSFGILLLASTITYSSVIFIPYYLLFMFYTYKYTVKKIVLTLIAASVAVAVAYSPLLFALNFQTIFAHLSPHNILTFSYTMPVRFVNNAVPMVSGIFLTSGVYTVFVLPVFVFLLVDGSNIRKRFVYIITPAIYLLFISSIKLGNIKSWWLMITEPFILIGLGFGIVSLWQAKYRLFSVIFVLILAQCLFQGYDNAVHWGNSSTAAKKTAREILATSEAIKLQENYKNNNFFQVIVSTTWQDNWHTTPVLYWLEVLTNKKYVRLVNYGESVEQTNNDNYIFWLCLGYGNETRNKLCFNKYIKNKNQYSLADTTFTQVAPEYFGYILKKKDR